jgi:long-chain acyl-CoA synthetase
MKNHRHLLEDCFGADRAGVYSTTISTHLLADEIAYIVRDCGAKVLVLSAELDALAAALPPLLPAGLCCFGAGTAAAGFESWDAAVDDARNEIPGSSRTPAASDGRVCEVTNGKRPANPS